MPTTDIVLLGAGHTHAHLLRAWRGAPIEGARLTCVSDFPEATYSGMLPGTLAGLYPPEKMRIDLKRLCAAGGARLLLGQAEGLDLQGRRLLFSDRHPVPYDILSIGIGSVPDRERVEVAGEALVPIKPMQTFLDRLDRRIKMLRAGAGGRAGSDGRPLRLAVAGGGAAGVEIAFCLIPRLRRLLGPAPFQVTLVEMGERLLPGMPAGAASLAASLLAARGVTPLFGNRVRAVTDAALVLEDANRDAGFPGIEVERPADIVLWATGARGPALLGKLGLPVDPRGFLLTRTTLQTTAGAPVFAVGDSGTIAGHPAAKAGVHAVRQGPVLLENIRRLLRGAPLSEYVPQRDFLRILATGDRRAILVYKGMTFHGRWCWRLKDAIDGRFVDRYRM